MSQLFLLYVLLGCTGATRLITTLMKAGTILDQIGPISVERPDVSFQLLVPIIPRNGFKPTACGGDILMKFMQDVRSTLLPLEQINALKKDLMTSRDQKFVGAIIGTAAMGVAVGASVTAGLALDHAYKNRRDIDQLHNAMSNSFDALEQLQDATKGLAVIIKDITNTINRDIIPAINTVNCELSKVALRGQLAAIFQKWLTIYSPILEAPLTSHKSALLTGTLLLDAINAGLSLQTTTDQMMTYAMNGMISVQLMEYNATTASVLLLVSVNARSETPGYKAYRTHSIMIAVGNPARYSVISLPSHMATNGINWYSVSDTCTQKSTGLVCTGSALSPFNEDLDKCVQGDTNRCMWTSSQGGSSFILLKSGILADCNTLICTCNSIAISGLRYISTDCPTPMISGTQYKIQATDLGYFVSNTSISYDPVPPVNISFIDVTSMQSIQKALNRSDRALQMARDALSRVSNGSGMSIETMVAIACGVTGVLVLLIIGLIGLIYAACKRDGTIMERFKHPKADAAYDNPMGPTRTINISDLV
ncbi:fusion protein [Wenling tonguesole paramyxovirus]|uniref:Fusion glycoprotein F0 n=1 Tax=Wenling tonguesole paramyxovirus TaxID=2116454 RepID=A0A2P1GN03_9MONO|nr:fusion protein [Wenling tonguesole paramyxovirus]AVM87376.1 fusion protein [Wenling tonguesole paramyxovirus]